MVLKCKELAIRKPTAAASSTVIRAIGPAGCLRVCVGDWRIRSRDLFLQVPSFAAVCVCYVIPLRQLWRRVRWWCEGLIPLLASHLNRNLHTNAPHVEEPLIREVI